MAHTRLAVQVFVAACAFGCVVSSPIVQQRHVAGRRPFPADEQEDEVLRRADHDMDRNRHFRNLEIDEDNMACSKEDSLYDSGKTYFFTYFATIESTLGDPEAARSYADSGNQWMTSLIPDMMATSNSDTKLPKLASLVECEVEMSKPTPCKAVINVPQCRVFDATSSPHLNSNKPIATLIGERPSLEQHEQILRSAFPLGSSELHHKSEQLSRLMARHPITGIIKHKKVVAVKAHRHEPAPIVNLKKAILDTLQYRPKLAAESSTLKLDGVFGVCDVEIKSTSRLPGAVKVQKNLAKCSASQLGVSGVSKCYYPTETSSRSHTPFFSGVVCVEKQVLAGMHNYSKLTPVQPVIFTTRAIVPSAPPRDIDREVVDKATQQSRNAITTTLAFQPIDETEAVEQLAHTLDDQQNAQILAKIDETLDKLVKISMSKSAVETKTVAKFSELLGFVRSVKNIEPIVQPVFDKCPFKKTSGRSVAPEEDEMTTQCALPDKLRRDFLLQALVQTSTKPSIQALSYLISREAIDRTIYEPLIFATTYVKLAKQRFAKSLYTTTHTVVDPSTKTYEFIARMTEMCEQRPTRYCVLGLSTLVHEAYSMMSDVWTTSDRSGEQPAVPQPIVQAVQFLVGLIQPGSCQAGEMLRRSFEPTEYDAIMLAMKAWGNAGDVIEAVQPDFLQKFALPCISKFALVDNSTFSRGDDDEWLTNGRRQSTREELKQRKRQHRIREEQQRQDVTESDEDFEPIHEEEESNVDNFNEGTQLKRVRRRLPTHHRSHPRTTTMSGEEETEEFDNQAEFDVRDGRYPHNVTCAAIFSIRRARPTAESKRILFEILKNPNAPVESRTAAGVLFTRFLGYDTRTEIAEDREMIQELIQSIRASIDEQIQAHEGFGNYQVLSFLVTHWKNVLRSNDPYYMPIARLLTTVEPILFDILTGVEREISQRRGIFSRAFEFSFYYELPFAVPGASSSMIMPSEDSDIPTRYRRHDSGGRGLPVGFQYEQIWIFSKPQSRLPSYISTNFSIGTILGPYFNAFEIGLDMHGVEQKLEETFGRVGLRGLLSTVTNIFDKMFVLTSRWFTQWEDMLYHYVHPQQLWSTMKASVMMLSTKRPEEWITPENVHQVRTIAEKLALAVQTGDKEPLVNELEKVLPQSVNVRRLAYKLDVITMRLMKAKKYPINRDDVLDVITIFTGLPQASVETMLNKFEKSIGQPIDTLIDAVRTFDAKRLFDISSKLFDKNIVKSAEKTLATLLGATYSERDGQIDWDNTFNTNEPFEEKMMRIMDKIENCMRGFNLGFNFKTGGNELAYANLQEVLSIVFHRVPAAVRFVMDLRRNLLSETDGTGSSGSKKSWMPMINAKLFDMKLSIPSGGGLQMSTGIKTHLSAAVKTSVKRVQGSKAVVKFAPSFAFETDVTLMKVGLPGLFDVKLASKTALLHKSDFGLHAKQLARKHAQIALILPQKPIIWAQFDHKLVLRTFQPGSTTCAEKPVLFFLDQAASAMSDVHDNEESETLIDDADTQAFRVVGKKVSLCAPHMLQNIVSVRMCAHITSPAIGQMHSQMQMPFTEFTTAAPLVLVKRVMKFAKLAFIGPTKFQLVAKPMPRIMNKMLLIDAKWSTMKDKNARQQEPWEIAEHQQLEIVPTDKLVLRAVLQDVSSDEFLSNHADENGQAEEEQMHQTDTGRRHHRHRPTEDEVSEFSTSDEHSSAKELIGVAKFFINRHKKAAVAEFELAHCATKLRWLAVPQCDSHQSFSSESDVDATTKPKCFKIATQLTEKFVDVHTQTPIAEAFVHLIIRKGKDKKFLPEEEVADMITTDRHLHQDEETDEFDEGAGHNQFDDEESPREMRRRRRQHTPRVHPIDEPIEDNDDIVPPRKHVVSTNVTFTFGIRAPGWITFVMKNSALKNAHKIWIEHQCVHECPCLTVFVPTSDKISWSLFKAKNWMTKKFMALSKTTNNMRPVGSLTSTMVEDDIVDEPATTNDWSWMNKYGDKIVDTWTKPLKFKLSYGMDSNKPFSHYYTPATRYEESGETFDHEEETSTDVDKKQLQVLKWFVTLKQYNIPDMYFPDQAVDSGKRDVEPLIIALWSAEVDTKKWKFVKLYSKLLWNMPFQDDALNMAKIEYIWHNATTSKHAEKRSIDYQLIMETPLIAADLTARIKSTGLDENGKYRTSHRAGIVIAPWLTKNSVSLARWASAKIKYFTTTAPTMDEDMHTTADEHEMSGHNPIFVPLGKIMGTVDEELLRRQHKRHMVRIFPRGQVETSVGFTKFNMSLVTITSAAGMDETTPVDSLEDDVKMSRKLSNLRRRHEHTSIDTPKLHMNAEWLVSFKPAFATDRYVQALHTNTLFDFVLNTKHIHMSSAELGTANSGEVPMETDTIFTLGYNTAGKATMIKRIGDEQLTEMLDRNPFKFIQSEMFDDHEGEQASAMKKPLTISMAGKIKIDRRNGLTTAVRMDTRLPKWLLSVWQTGMEDQFSTMPEEDDETILPPSTMNSEDEQFLDIPTKSWSKKLTVDQLFNINVLKRSVVSSMNITSPIWSAKTWVQLIGAKKTAMQDEEIATGDKNLLELIASSSSFSAHPALKKLATHKADAHFVVEKKSGQNDASAHKIVRAKAKFEHALISTHTEAKLKLKRIEFVLPEIAERLPICTDCAMKMFNAVLPTSTLRRLAVPTKIDIKHAMLLKNARKPEFTMHLFTGNTPAASSSSSENVAREDIFADTANFDSVGKSKLITLIVAVAKKADQEQPKKIVFEIGTKQPSSLSSAAAELNELVDTNQKSMILYAKATHIPTTKSVAVNFVALPTRIGVEVEQHNMLTGAGADDEDFSAVGQEVSNQKKFKILQIDLKLKPTAEDDGMFMEDFVPARARHRVQSSSTSALTRALEGRKLVAHAHVKPQHLAKVARKLYISTLDTAIAGVDLLLPQESIDMATKKLDRLLKDPSHPIAQTFSKLAMSSHSKSLEELIATANKRTQTWMLKTLAGVYVDQSPMAFGLWSNLKDILVAAPLETKWKVQRFVPQELRPMVRDLDRMLAWVVEKIDHQSSRYARHFDGVDATELAVAEPNAMSRTYQHDELALAVRNVLVQIKHDLIATLRALKSPSSSFATSGQWFSSWMSPCSLSAKANQYEAAMKIKDTIRFVFNVLEQARRSIVRAVGGRVRPASDDFTITDSPNTPMLFGGRDFDLRELGVAINSYIPNELPSLWCSNKHVKDSWFPHDEAAPESSWFSSPFSASQSPAHASMAQNVAAKLAQVATNLSQRLPIKLAVQNSPAEGVVGIDVEMPIVSGNQLKKLVDFSDATTAQYYDYNIMSYLAKPYDTLMSVVKSFTKRTSHMWEPVSTNPMSTEQSETADNQRASGRIRHLNKSWTPTSDSSMWFNPFSSQHNYNFMTRFSDIFGGKNQRDTHRHHQHSHLPQYIGYVWSSQSESKFRFAYTMDGQFIPMPKPTTTNEPCTYLLLSDESSNMFTISVVPELKTLRLHFKEPSSVQIDFVLPNAAESITTTIEDSSSPSSMLEEPKITLDGSHPIRHIPFESNDGTVAIKRVGREYVIVAAELGLTVRCDSIYGFCQINATKDSHEGQRLKGLLAPKLAWSPDSQIKDNNVLARRLNAAAVGNTKQQCQVEPAQMNPQQQPQAAGALQCSEAHKQTAEKKCSQVFSAKLNNKSAWKSEAFSTLHPELFMIGCVRDYCQALSTSSSSRTMPTEDHTSGDNENAVLALCTWAGIYRDIIFAHEGKTLPIVPEICQREVCFNQPMNQPFPIQADSTSQSDVDVVLVVSLAKAMTQAVGGRATGVSEVQRKLEQIAEIVEQRLTSLSSNGEKRIRFGLVGFNGAASHHGHHASEHAVNSPALMTVAVRGAADSMIFDQAVPVRKQPHTITLSEQNSASPRLYGTLSALRQAVHEQLRFAGRSGQHALNVDPLYAVKFALDTYQFNPEASKLLLVFTEQDKSVHYSSPRVDALKQQAVKAGVTVNVFSNYIVDSDSTGSSGGMWDRHRNEQTMRSDEDEIIAINHDDVAYLASGRVEQNIAFPKQQLARLAKATHGAVFNWPALLEQSTESSSAAIQHVGELVAQQVTRQSRCTRVCTCTVKDAFTPQQTMTYCELSC